MTKGLRNTILISLGVAVVFTTIVIIYTGRNSGELKYPEKAKWVKEKNAIAEVKRLHPKLRQKASDFFTDVEKLGYTVYITDADRTSEEQAHLNHENPANANAGLSDHEYGLAFDINIKKDGKIILRKATPKSEWIKSGVVDIAKKHGFKWGGNFSNYYDPIHFYNDFGIPAPQMKKLKQAGKVDKEGYIIV